MTRIRLLWIEDETQHEMQGFIGPLYAALKYDITIAKDASEALLELEKQYDVVIVDIRIPPGEAKPLQTIYNKHDGDPSAAKLGLLLLRTLLGRVPYSKDEDYIPGAANLHPIDSSRIAVFSVEAEDLRQELKEMGITHVLAKRASLPRLALVELTDEIINATRESQA